MSVGFNFEKEATMKSPASATAPSTMAAPDTSATFFRVQLIGHEDGEDPNTHSKVVLYRTVVQYNGQAFERALRFSRFYAFYSNLTSAEKKAINASFPRRYPFVAELDEERLKKREKQLNVFFAELCKKPITPTMELTLLNLFKIKERHLGPQIRGSILYVPRPRVDGTSSESSFQPPVRRVFNNGSSMMTTRSSIQSQSSLASNMSFESDVSRQLFQQRVSISSSVASPLPSTRSWVSTTSNMSDIVEAHEPRQVPSPLKMDLFVAGPVLPPAAPNFQAQVQKHMETIGKMLHDDDLHLLSPAATPLRPPTTYLKPQ